MSKSKLLGLIDGLEAKVLESKKVPLTEKIMLEEQDIMMIIDKIRSILNSEEFISPEIQKQPDIPIVATDAPTQNNLKSKVNQELAQAQKIKDGAQDYAQYVLNNLQLAVTKMQNNLVKLEKNIESGRKVIEEKNKEVTGIKHEILEKEILNESI
jgi:hypothetical protein